MIDRVQIWLASITGRKRTKRHVSRREREEAQRRLLIIGVAVVSVVLVVVLAAGAFYQYIYLPRESLASVNGHKIERSDYWKVRKLDLLNQVSQYSQIAQFSSGDQATQYQNLAQQAQTQLKTVESDPVDATTLNQMVDDQVVIDGLSKLGLSISDQEMDDYQAQQFAPAPIGSPTPTLPLDPTAAAWATATAEATASATAAAPTATPEATASPDASAAGSPAAASGTPSASPTAAGTPAAASPTPTLQPGEARATATTNFNQYKQVVLDQAGMSVSDFRRLVIRPNLARQKVTQKLESEVPTRALQIQASQIMVATEDAANAIVNQTLKTKDFADVAKEQSADTTTAVNGGQLGWLPKGIMTPEFDKAAFSLQVGEVSKPCKDKYGWEIVKVTAIDPDRPITAETLNQLRTLKTNDWLQSERAASNIDWQIGSPMPSPTAQTQFVPPPDAPPTPTPVPTPTPAATPEATVPPAAATPTP
jgi:parvulin-like peptidyl-prolyl isomerase